MDLDDLIPDSEDETKTVADKDRNSACDSKSLEHSMETFHSFLRSDKCRSILALVGAGLSASSNLPTFRGAGGYWRNYSPIDLATPDAFYSDPGLVWQFYAYRRHMALQAEPNSGHRALARLSQVHTVDFMTITQNVDDLSQKAGHDLQKLLEFHGSLFELRCTEFSCSYKSRNFDDPLTSALDVTKFDRDLPHLDPSQLPRCPQCGGLLRPGVVWFGESLPLQPVDRADEFIVRNGVDLILVIGTSCSVWPAASYVDIAKNQGGKVAIFNTEVDSELNDWQFIGDCAKTLPEALEMEPI